MVYQKLTPPSCFKSMGFVTYSKLLKCLVKLESYPRLETVCSIEDIPLTWDTLEIKAVHLSPQSSPGPLYHQTGPAKHLVDLAPDIFGRCLCWCWWVLVVVLLVGSYYGAGVGAPSSASPAVGAAGLVSDRGPSNRNTIWLYFWNHSKIWNILPVPLPCHPFGLTGQCRHRHARWSLSNFSSKGLKLEDCWIQPTFVGINAKRFLGNSLVNFRVQSLLWETENRCTVHFYALSASSPKPLKLKETHLFNHQAALDCLNEMKWHKLRLVLLLSYGFAAWATGFVHFSGEVKPSSPPPTTLATSNH